MTAGKLLAIYWTPIMKLENPLSKNLHQNRPCNKTVNKLQNKNEIPHSAQFPRKRHICTLHQGMMNGMQHLKSLRTECLASIITLAIVRTWVPNYR